MLFNYLIDKVILNINVLYTDIKLRIFKQLNYFLIVSLNNDRIYDIKIRFIEKIVKLNSFLNSLSFCYVFSFYKRQSDSLLMFK